jgi:membrane protease YdiL (CAAX protease family)
MSENSPDGLPKTENVSPSGPEEFPAKIFLKEQGLRAGWRLLLYGAIFMALMSAGILVLSPYFRSSRGAFSPSSLFASEFTSFLAALAAAWIMSGLERRQMAAYGLPARGAFGKLFWQGCLFGFFEISALIGTIAAFGGYSFGSLAEHGWAIARWGLYWACFFLAVAFLEEFLFRGYTLYTLAEGIGFWPAAVLLSVGFGAVHLRNPGEGWAGAAGVVLIGLFWSFTLRRTGTLWFALGMHFSFDFGETFVYSVPDSGAVFPGLSNASLSGPSWLTGGRPGPEASVFDFLIIALLFLVFHLMYPAKHQQPIPQSAREIS